MKTFPLTVATPDGMIFDGNVERIKCRTITGDMAILANHCNFCTALGMGEATIVLEDGTRKDAACIGGMLSVMNGECHLLATTWEWEDDIDMDRALRAKQKAEERLAKYKQDTKEFKMAESKLHRALVRISVKQ